MSFRLIPHRTSLLLELQLYGDLIPCSFLNEALIPLCKALSFQRFHYQQHLLPIAQHFSGVKKILLEDQMNWSKKDIPHMPMGTCTVKIVEREWGIQRVYRSPDGLEQSISASLDSWFFSSYAYSRRRALEDKNRCLFKSPMQVADAAQKFKLKLVNILYTIINSPGDKTLNYVPLNKVI